MHILVRTYPLLSFLISCFFFLFLTSRSLITGGCCLGNFGVAQSKDGILFEIVSLNIQPLYKSVDCNGLFVDDDGTAYLIKWVYCFFFPLFFFDCWRYVFYSSLDENHMVSIEKLTPDYLNTTLENYGFFPDNYVEGSVLFKRNGTAVYYFVILIVNRPLTCTWNSGIYYAGYGSCCCFCRAGSGFTVFSATDIKVII